MASPEPPRKFQKSLSEDGVAGFSRAASAGSNHNCVGCYEAETFVDAVASTLRLIETKADPFLIAQSLAKKPISLVDRSAGTFLHGNHEFNELCATRVGASLHSLWGSETQAVIAQATVCSFGFFSVFVL
eukprot:SAG11_NODE_3738_length_2257_cov_1.570436_1_plen_130_part_00